MNKQLNALFSVLIKALTALTVMVLAFVIYFIVKEHCPRSMKWQCPISCWAGDGCLLLTQGSRPLAFLIS